MSCSFEIGKVYTFDVYPTIIDRVFKHVTCTGIFDYQTALMLNPNLESLHAQVYPYLPSNTPDHAYQHQYIQFRLQDGSHALLGYPWINHKTIKVSEAMKIVIELREVGLEDLPHLRETLKVNNFNNFTLDVLPDIQDDNQKPYKAVYKLPQP